MKKLIFALSFLMLVLVSRAQPYYVSGCGWASVNGTYSNLNVGSLGYTNANGSGWILGDMATATNWSPLTVLQVSVGNAPGGVGALNGNYYQNTNITFFGNPSLTNSSGAYFSTSRNPNDWYLIYASHQYYAALGTDITTNWQTSYGGTPVPVVTVVSAITNYYQLTPSNHWVLYNLALSGGHNTYISSGAGPFSNWQSFGVAPYLLPVPVVTTNPVVPVVNTPVTNFWTTNRSRVTFSAAGWNNSLASSNVLNVLVGGGVIYQSPPTAGRGGQFTLFGAFDFDGTNLATSVQYNTGDTNYPVDAAFTTVTNFTPTNATFSISLDPTQDTNLFVTAGSIQSAAFIPGVGQAQANLVASPTPGLSQSQYTPTNSSDVTLGNVIGLIRWDGSYIYIGTATNAWKRTAISTW